MSGAIKTITIQIGNSDNKLTQEEWSKFVESVHYAVHQYGVTVHFWDGSVNWAQWQNMCWVFECDKKNAASIKKSLVEIRTTYHQDSIAYLEGKTEFI